MIVVGGRHSSNTQKLLNVCQAYCPSFLVETPEELNGIKLDGFHSIGVTAGASAPAGIIKEVLQTMSEIVDDNKMIEEEKAQDSEFLAAVDAIETTNDPKVVGTVLSVTPTEIQVDIGRKQTGYVTYEEYSDNPDADPMS
jgi:4-hydroxy-3-methylbut-2-enyl diphosphate reductase